MKGSRGGMATILGGQLEIVTDISLKWHVTTKHFTVSRIHKIVRKTAFLDQRVLQLLNGCSLVQIWVELFDNFGALIWLTMK